MSIHLAIVTPFPPSGSSIGQYGYYLSNALAQTGNFARITILAQIPHEPQENDLRLPLQIERLWYPNRLDTSLKIFNRLRQLMPDIVWFNLGLSSFGTSPLPNVAGLFGPWIIKMLRFPTVITLHELIGQADLRRLRVPGGQLAAWGKNFVQLISTRADVVCVTLRQHAKYLSQRNPKIQLLHIPHGAFTAPVILEGSLNPEILFFGYVAPFKGLELLLNVFLDLHLRHPTIRLTIAGGEHPRFPGYLKKIQSTFRENPAIYWRGYVPENELRQVFADATVVVVPSTASTGSSSVIYRAAAWGRPIVASDLPELKAAAGEENLWVEFFPTGSDIALRLTLERLLKDPIQRTNQSNHNFHIIKNHLTLTHTSQAYLHAFKLALFEDK